MHSKDYPCKQCILEGKATDFVMTTFDRKKYKGWKVDEVIRYGFEALENQAVGN